MSRTFSRRAFGAAVATGTAISAIESQLVAQTSTPESEIAVSPKPDSPLTPELPHGGIQEDGSWQFTDDLGDTISLPETPTRVVAFIGYAAALYELGYEVVGYFGAATNDDGSPAAVAGNLPTDRIPSVALNDNDYSVDVEKLINVEAELLVGPNYSITTLPAVIWPLDADAMDIIGQVVQTVHIAADDGTDVERTIKTIANLAEALGVDPENPDVVNTREAYEAAKANLADAIAAKPNLTTLWMSGYASGFWIGSTSDVDFIRNLGANVVADELAIAGEQSWETFPTLEADLIFNDDRPPYWWGVEQLTEEIPTYGLHPAVAAGQVASWHNTFVPGYAHFTPILEEYTQVFLDADETVVP